MFEYQVGGSLAVNNPTYIERQADRDLYEALLAGELCYVLTCRQMGKSSLRLRTRHRIEASGQGRCVSIDMTRIGSEDITPSQWYQGIAFDLLRGLRLYQSIDLSAWWTAQGNLSPVQKLSQFLAEVVLGSLQDEKLFIFVDEIDSVQSLNFAVDDFFALIRYCYNQRAENPDYARLSWTLFGVASPRDLISDVKRTPFNVGVAIALPGFTFAEATPLLPGLAPFVDHPQPVLAAILAWTDGQPFLTQKMCDLVQQEGNHSSVGRLSIPSGGEDNWVEGLVRSRIIERWPMQDEPEHLRTIQRFVQQDPTKTSRLLGLYQQLLQAQGAIALEDASEPQEFTPLFLAGLVTQQTGVLKIRNRIYQHVFDRAWVEQQLANLRPYAAAVNAWTKSSYRGESHLLGGKALLAAQHWSEGKSLSDRDYQFLAASQLSDRRHRERRIVEILSVLNYRTGMLKPYLREIAIAVSELVSLDWSVVTFCQDDDERILASSFDMGSGAEQAYNLHMTLTGYVFRSGGPLFVEDTATCKDYGEPPKGYRSYLGVPLKLSTGEIVGTICSFHSTPRKFVPEEVRLASIFAERAASAIENYQLYQKLQEMNEELHRQLERQRHPLAEFISWLRRRLSRY